jgi:pyridoxine/pyridoxamine 5'-phosphate oxidase
MSDLPALRREYAARSLDEGDVDPDPFAQFGRWFDEALKPSCRSPTR